MESDPAQNKNWYLVKVAAAADFIVRAIDEEFAKFRVELWCGENAWYGIDAHNYFQELIVAKPLGPIEENWHETTVELFGDLKQNTDYRAMPNSGPIAYRAPSREPHTQLRFPAILNELP